MSANPKTVEALDADDFQKAVYVAILRQLGVVGLVRYIRENLSSERDYVQERKAWVDSENLEDVMREVQELDLKTIDNFLFGEQRNMTGAHE